MTAFASLSAFLTAVANRRRVDACKNSLTTDVNIMTSLWRAAGMPDQGAIPTTAAVPTNATTGGLQQPDAGGGSNEQWMFIRQLQGSARGVLILADRLSHQGGLSATVTGAQATNLPTSALTRYTDGVGVLAAAEIYTQIGTTATTITMSYTDDAGNAGQTSQPIDFGGTGRREVGKLLPFSLAAGDRGVRAVASVNIVATTGTAGAFGVTLFKPLIACPLVTDIPYTNSGDIIERWGGVFAKVFDGACLWPILLAPAGINGLQFEAAFVQQ